MILHLTTQLCLPPKEYPFVVARKANHWRLAHQDEADSIGYLNHPPYWFVSQEWHHVQFKCAELTIAMVVSFRHPDHCHNPGDLLYLGHCKEVPPEFRRYRWGNKVFHPFEGALKHTDHDGNTHPARPPYLWFLGD